MSVNEQIRGKWQSYESTKGSLCVPQIWARSGLLKKALRGIPMLIHGQTGYHMLSFTAYSVIIWAPESSANVTSSENV
jgi:hypothetical protein